MIAMAVQAVAVETGQVSQPRVIVLTDIENEPDDATSLFRFLVHANQWDTEALIATTDPLLNSHMSTRTKTGEGSFGPPR